MLHTSLLPLRSRQRPRKREGWKATSPERLRRRPRPARALQPGCGTLGPAPALPLRPVRHRRPGPLRAGRRPARVRGRRVGSSTGEEGGGGGFVVAGPQRTPSSNSRCVLRDMGWAGAEPSCGAECGARRAQARGCAERAPGTELPPAGQAGAGSGAWPGAQGCSARQGRAEQRSPRRRRALTQPHEGSAVGEWGPQTADNEATVPGQARPDGGAHRAGTRVQGRGLGRTTARRGRAVGRLRGLRCPTRTPQRRWGPGRSH